MIRLQQINIPIPSVKDGQLLEEQQKRELIKKIAKILHLQEENIQQLHIIKRSLDARKKPRLFYSYVVEVSVAQERQILAQCRDKNVSLALTKPYCFAPPRAVYAHPPVIIGMGPAGLFCGYFLAKYGYCPVILERGKAVEERQKDVERFWESGILNPESNVQFGEGGAGTFSDGKLNTLVKDKYGRNREVLRILVEHGAPENILYDSKPHIGTDILRTVVMSMRKQMLAWGADIRFETKMTGFQVENNRITGVTLADGSAVSTDCVVLAVGHSARDVFSLCEDRKIAMEAKPFAVGFRVEHPQGLINESQYGRDYPACLPPASYKLTAKTDSGRGVYSFCMCPGGYVVNASSEEGRLAVNGMSYSGRDGANANSAIIVSVTPDDYPGSGPLAGVAFQRRLEEKAFALGKGRIPVQYYKDFRKEERKEGRISADFHPSIKGGYVFAQVNELLPEELNRAFIQGMEHFHRVIPGFGDDYACISGVESRTSSPVRILRNEQGQASLAGLYPCGEGAGYAGGITSAAMDGIFIAERIAQQE
jgi:hypothetical protein